MKLIRRNINTSISVDAVLGTPLNNAYHAENDYDPLAQAVEHLTFNQGVPSSNLGWVTKMGYIFEDIHPGGIQTSNMDH